MKKQLILALMLLCTLSGAAQSVKNDSIHEKFFNAKVRELVYRLEMSDEQKSKFLPIYRRYNDEMRAVWSEGRSKKEGGRPQADKNNPNKPARSSADVAAMKKRQLQMQQKAQGIQMKYLDEFAKVFDAKQINKFYEVEAKIQKKLMERKNHQKGGKDVRPKGKPGKRPDGKAGVRPAAKEVRNS